MCAFSSISIGTRELFDSLNLSLQLNIVINERHSFTCGNRKGAFNHRKILLPVVEEEEEAEGRNPPNVRILAQVKSSMKFRIVSKFIDNTTPPIASGKRFF